jgi:toxin ParE1/3/4
VKQWSRPRPSSSWNGATALCDMLTIRYSVPAQSDLIDIANYLERQASPAVAAAVLKRIRRQVKSLAHNALRYRERRELGEGRRAISVAPYLVFYRVEGATVIVQRILHGARNIQSAAFDET